MSFLYTGTLRLSQENVLLVLAGANQLGISPAVDLCQQFLVGSVEIGTVEVGSLDQKNISFEAVDEIFNHMTSKVGGNLFKSICYY